MEQPRRRKPLPKRLRFDVFKRDSFKCQYCGSEAPRVLLQVDHILPVAEGGTDDIGNLITSCADCNAGKADRKLDDDTALVKQRAQLEELQARREQLEMMMEWHRELRSLAQDTVEQLCSYWNDLTPGRMVNDHGKATVKKWLRRYTVQEILHAMDAAAEQYLETTDDGTCTAESWEHAFSKIPAICRVERASKDDPDLKELFYIRGIVRKRLSYCNDHQALDMLRAARSWDVTLDELRDIALRARNWTAFRTSIDEVITRQQALVGDDGEVGGHAV